MTFGVAYLLLGLVWVGCAAGGGGLLALLAKRLHPSLSFRKLWAFYSVLLAAAAGLLFVIGYF